MKKSLSLFLALVMALSFLSACSSGTNTSTDTASPSNTEAATSESSEAQTTEPDASETAAWPRTIVDGAGNEVVLETKTERVTLLHIVYLEHFLQLGVIPTAAAIGNALGEVESLEESELYGPYIQGTEEMTLLGSSAELNLEAVLESEPDVIVTFYAGSPLEQYDQLSAIAPVIQIDYYAAWQDQLQMVAQVLGKEEESQGVITEIEDTIADAKETIAPTADRTLGLFRTDGKDFITQGFSQYYTEFGISKPEGFGDTETISLEAVAEMNPYYIVFQHNFEAAQAFVESMEDSSVWNAMDAVQNDRIYYFDENMNSYGPLTWRLASEKLVEMYTAE